SIRSKPARLQPLLHLGLRMLFGNLGGKDAIRRNQRIGSLGLGYNGGSAERALPGHLRRNKRHHAAATLAMYLLRVRGNLYVPRVAAERLQIIVRKGGRGLRRLFNMPAVAAFHLA